MWGRGYGPGTLADGLPCARIAKYEYTKKCLLR